MMAKKNPDSITEPNGAAADKPLETAFWPIPGTTARVLYSLPLFHDIDFAVNEGYRKIPHGGIEVGALLFGFIKEDGVSIEAFRRIECEHAYGPSFMLSERDLSGLEAQIRSAASDSDLAGFELLGWFLAHTRGPLQMTDPELELFDRFFPTPGQLTLLVKPERFQPTLFGFLVRGPDGKVLRDATPNAIILPLAGRVGRAAGSGPQSSLPAPKAVRTSAPRPAPREPEPLEEVPEQAPPEAPPEESSTTADIRAARRRLKFEEARLLAQGDDTISAAQPQLISGSPADSFPRDLVQIKRKRSRAFDLPEAEGEDLYPQFDELTAQKPATSTSRLMFVLPLAALIGSAVGYVAYRQIPSPIIPLNARPVAQSVLISWPSSETRDSAYAAIRVDDAAPVALSSGEKAAGQLELAMSRDMKIELITHNWLRNSRGIVRFVKAAPAER